MIVDRQITVYCSRERTFSPPVLGGLCFPNRRTRTHLTNGSFSTREHAILLLLKQHPSVRLSSSSAEACILFNRTCVSWMTTSGRTLPQPESGFCDIIQLQKKYTLRHMYALNMWFVVCVFSCVLANDQKYKRTMSKGECLCRIWSRLCLIYKTHPIPTCRSSQNRLRSAPLEILVWPLGGTN